MKLKHIKEDQYLVVIHNSIQELPAIYNSLQDGPANQTTTNMNKMVPVGIQRIANSTKSAFRVKKVTYVGIF